MMRGGVVVKITSIGVNGINPYNKQTVNVKPKEAKTNVADKIEISTTAKALSTSLNYSTDRAQKVQKLKEEIQSGEYKVDAHKVAEDLLNYYRK